MQILAKTLFFAGGVLLLAGGAAADDLAPYYANPPAAVEAPAAAPAPTPQVPQQSQAAPPAQAPAPAQATRPAPNRAAAPAAANAAGSDYLLGAGDVIRITVFQNPDLTTETRVSESGQVSFPLIGMVKLSGISISAAEKLIAGGLRKGGYVVNPQVTIFPVEIRANQVSVLGEVNKPGRYPLDTSNMRVADMLAMAGGVGPEGSDMVVVRGVRGGKAFQREIALGELFTSDGRGNEPLAGGDILYVARAPVFFIYGQVQKPGSYRLQRGMTLMQALATGGGLTNRGTERGMQVHRRAPSGKLDILSLGMNDPLQPDDVIYVKESLF